MANCRMMWRQTPNFSFFHDASVVFAGAFEASPSAKQARPRQGQTEWTRHRDRAAGKPGVFRGEGHRLTNGAERGDVDHE